MLRYLLPGSRTRQSVNPLDLDIVLNVFTRRDDQLGHQNVNIGILGVFILNI